MLTYKLLFLYSVVSCSYTYCQQLSSDTFALLRADYDQSRIKVLKQIRGSGQRSICSFIADHTDTVFLLKQTTSKKPYGELIAVRDMFVSHLAELHSISVNRVRLTQKESDFPGKVKKVVATVHLVVPGSILSKKSELFIQQPYGYFDKPSMPIPQELWGMSSRVIHNMAEHDDLPAIVALDTFVGNASRRRNSLFYDQVTHKFYGIDLESTLVRPIPRLAVLFFQKLLQNKDSILTSQELRGLKIYRDTLNVLVKNHNPKKQHALLDSFVQQAGIDTKDKQVIELIALYKKTITDNYADSREVITILDSLFSLYKNKKAYA